MIPWAQSFKIAGVLGSVLYFFLAFHAMVMPIPKLAPIAQTDLDTQRRIGRDELQEERNSQQNVEFERRLNAIDAQNLGERMARQEAVNESNHTLLVALVLGVLMIIIDRGLQFAKGIKKGP